jgi:glycosyltransferase involved in cell wall biosynthesis
MSAPLSVWLIQTGEPLPFEAGAPRLLRTSLLAKTLRARGHGVLWFASNFSHFSKTHYFPGQTEVTTPDGIKILCMDARPYRRHISLERLISHDDLRRAFRREAANRPRPDVIIASFPNPDLVLEACRYATPRGTPVLTDIRDLWPDAWTFIAPKLMRPLARLALSPFYHQVRKGLAASTGLIGVSEPVLAWGLSKANRVEGAQDRVFNSAYERRRPTPKARAQADAFWRDQGVFSEPQAQIACFIGGLSSRSSSELLNVARTFQQMDDRLRRRWKLVLCGAGDLAEPLRSIARSTDNIVLPGFVDADQIWSLMQRARVGLIPYANDPDFLSGYPNKFGEYLSAGLPIISFLKGVVGDTLISERCGWTYSTPAQLMDRLIKAEDEANFATARENATRLYDRAFDATQLYAAYADFVEDVAAVRTSP